MTNYGLMPHPTKRRFDDNLFTKRELRIMSSLAVRFRDDMTEPLINITHAERGPWDAIWDQGRGNNQRIPYTLAAPESGPNREAVLEASDLHEGIAAADSLRH